MPNNTPSWEEVVDEILNAFEWHVMALRTTGKLTKKEAKAALNSAVKELVLASKPDITFNKPEGMPNTLAVDFAIRHLDTYQANIIKAIDGSER